jgi:hypothetical protein
MRSRPASVATDDVRGSAAYIVLVCLVLTLCSGRLDLAGLMLAGWAAVNLVDRGVIAVQRGL